MSNRHQKKFAEFHEDNPHVYDMFVSFTKQAKQANRKYYSSYAIFERMRWYTDIETDGEPFKLNNNYRPYYARKVMEEYPEFEGFFRIREIKND